MPPCYRSTYKRKVRGQETKDASVEPSSPVLFYEWNQLRSPREPADLKSQNSGKGLFGPNGRRGGKVGFDEFGGGGEEVGNCGGNGGRGSSIFGRGGGSLAICSMESKDGLGGGGLVVVGEECLDGYVGAGGGEVKGGGVDFGVTKSLLGEIPAESTGESGGEEFGVDGGAV
ncbi:hypothetical protein Tco_1349167 [Tanacetum coccineum]